MATDPYVGAWPLGFDRFREAVARPNPADLEGAV